MRKKRLSPLKITREIKRAVLRTHITTSSLLLATAAMEEERLGEQGDCGVSDSMNQEGENHRRRRSCRTADVSSSVSSFEDLALPSWLVSGLEDCGFIEPSPVQVREREKEKEWGGKREKREKAMLSFVFSSQFFFPSSKISQPRPRQRKKFSVSLSLFSGPGHPARPLRRRPPRARPVRDGQDGRLRRPCRPGSCGSSGGISSIGIVVVVGAAGAGPGPD